MYNRSSCLEPNIVSINIIQDSTRVLVMWFSLNLSVAGSSLFISVSLTFAAVIFLTYLFSEEKEEQSG